MAKLTHEEVDEAIRKILEPPKQAGGGRELLSKLMSLAKGKNEPQ